MTTMDRKHFAALARQAAALQQVWLREREERRALQLADDAEIRRRWLESDSPPDEQSQPVRTERKTKSFPFNRERRARSESKLDREAAEEAGRPGHHRGHRKETQS